MNNNPTDPNVTNCEQAILQLYCDGYHRSEIARIKSISEHTVDNHRKSLLKKMKCGSIARATVLGVNLGLIELRFVGE